MASDQKQYVVLVGNLSDGFKALGPFNSFEEACEACPGPDVWVMRLTKPAE
jgi:hypothetical protein